MSQWNCNSLLALSILVCGVMGCREPARFDPNDPLTGVWIGKWDDTWAVMFIIKRSGTRYDVVYKWEENTGYPFESMRHQTEAKGDTLSFGGIVIKLDHSQPGLANAKGKFKTPRTAHLVRIDAGDESILTVSRVKQLLAEHEQGASTR